MKLALALTEIELLPLTEKEPLPLLYMDALEHPEGVTDRVLDAEPLAVTDTLTDTVEQCEGDMLPVVDSEAEADPVTDADSVPAPEAEGLCEPLVEPL